jgi:hypothetical protein
MARRGQAKKRGTRDMMRGMQLRKGPTGGMILAAALFLCVCPVGPGVAEAEPDCPVPPGQEIVVTRATAGGTLITADGAEIVLGGLAFPEVADPGSESDGLAAMIDAVVQLGTGTLHIAAEGPPDRYGRLHGDAYLPDGRWLQAELVTAGVARVRPDGRSPPCVRALLARESIARNAGTGLWSDSNFRVKSADDPSLLARNGLYDLVEGRVVSVGYGSRMVFLDFGRDFRTDFTVMVPNTLVPRLLEAGIALETSEGRAVRVRGVVEDSGGPAIRIADPFALEILDRAE